MRWRRNVAAVSRLTRILRSLLSPPKLLELRSPHRGVVVSAAGDRPRAALLVKAHGTGVLGRASQKQVVIVAQRGGKCVVLVGRHGERVSFR